MFSSKYTERHWEIVRDYLVRSYFEDVSMPSFSTTSEDEDANNARSTSSGEIPPPSPITLPRISPLPELIIEKVNRDSLYDDPEEFYENLEAKVNKLINNMKRTPRCDDINDQDTIKIMDPSQGIATDDELLNLSPVSHICNATYTILNDFSTETDINDGNSETVMHIKINANNPDHIIKDHNRKAKESDSSSHNTSVTANSNDKNGGIFNQSSESSINTNSENANLSRNETRSNNTKERSFSIQNSSKSNEESITFTVEDNKMPNYYYASKKKSGVNKINIENDSFESQYKLVSAEVIADVHSVPANLFDIIETADSSKSPILGVNKNNSENYYSEDSNVNHSLEESTVVSRYDSEESTNMERLDTILEESESQLKDKNDISIDYCQVRDKTQGSKSQSNSVQEINANISNNPETMRATNINSFRTTRFSFTFQDADNELDIFSVPNITAKKHLEIQEETEEMDGESNSSLAEAPMESEANTNVDFVTSTPKSGTFNLIGREINAESPHFINNSQQCDFDQFETNTRKRRANNTVNNEHHLINGEDGKFKWESLKKRFFVGVPKVYRLCNCSHHSCT